MCGKIRSLNMNAIPVQKIKKRRIATANGLIVEAQEAHYARVRPPRTCCKRWMQASRHKEHLKQIVSLPMFYAMNESDGDCTRAAMREVLLV
jgi:hypothetical protein